MSLRAGNCTNTLQARWQPTNKHTAAHKPFRPALALYEERVKVPLWTNSKPFSTPFLTVFSKEVCFYMFCLPNYFVPLKRKGQRKKWRWQYQSGSPTLWNGSNDARVDQPLAAMLILERSWAVAFQRSLHKWASRGMIPLLCHIRENRIVAE